MEHEKPVKEEKVRLFSGLGRTLAISFLVFALFPLTWVSIISYQKAYKSLERDTQTLLETVAHLKTWEIHVYFNKMLADISFQAEALSNYTLLNEMVKAYPTSGKSLKDFVKSFQWALIEDEFTMDLIKFRRSFNYYDIFLISLNGDIMYTVAGENDLGTNLFTGLHKTSRFAAACKKTIETGNVHFSDYERYDPSKNEVSGFITAPVVNPEGDKIGVMAFQFPIGPINIVMQRGSNFGKTAEVYLVGPDLTLRSKLVHHPEKLLIQEKILTTQTRLFEEHLDAAISFEDMEHKAFIYKGQNGEQVLGIHHDILVQDIHFGVIAEINKEEAFALVYDLRQTMIIMVSVTCIVILIFIPVIVRQIVKPILLLSSSSKKVTQGDYTTPINVIAKNEIGDLSRSFAAMLKALKQNEEESHLKNWFQKGQMELNAKMRGIQNLPDLSREIVTFLSKYFDADIGVLYIAGNNNRFKLAGSYAFSKSKKFLSEFDYGQGLPGQAALEKKCIVLTRVPDDYIEIKSGLGDAAPRSILVNPFVRNDEVLGVVEIGTLGGFSEKALEFMGHVSESIAIGIHTIQGNVRVENLLEESQTQTEKLEVQQEELRLANDSLEKQTGALKKSQSDLRSQKEELAQINEELSQQSAELEEQAALLEEQKAKLRRNNIELENTKTEIEKKASDLEASGKYKSEFLANMSHELRTPLNSILLLSKYLADNRDRNLTPKQVECASTVHGSGNELLSLINQVLDLAKVESGKMILELETIALADITGAMKRNFKPVADNQNVTFNIKIADNLPETITTDSQRVSQIIKNLLSNAFKFTEKGSVTLDIRRPAMSETDVPDTFIAFTVKDTGLGIPKEKHDTVFQAFKQADGSTGRNFGGTGLGLSISRELALMLGGKLTLESQEGQGSLFTLYLPETIKEKTPSDTQSEATAGKPATIINEPAKLVKQASDNSFLNDDRNLLPTKEDRSILIIEEDLHFAGILRDTAREKGFKTLVAESGETGLHLTDCYTPDGIILDMKLPGMDGKAVLSRLKENLATRHIPVHIVSGSDKALEPLHMGAIGYLTKPVSMEAVDRIFRKIEHVLSNKIKKVLVIEDNKATQSMLVELIGNGMVKTFTAGTGQEAKTLIKENDFDCIILDLVLPDISGIELLTQLREQEDFEIPVIVHTAKDLTMDERAELDGLSGKIVLKDTKSREKILDDICLFLHRVETDLPDEKRAILKMIHDKKSILEGKKILIVDDDMRNVFALINTLEDKKIITVIANNGKESLKKITENSDINLVLMDIMMPEMDGYTAMEKIRGMESKIKNIPIIALTAKAMKGDRTKCIKAGASDYLSKPVDTEKLLSMLRVWLY